MLTKHGENHQAKRFKHQAFRPSSPCDAAEAKWTFYDQAGKCLSAASFGPLVKRLRSAGNPQGMELGRLFLLTLLPRRKRVRRRAGTQPCALVVCVAELKILQQTNL
ncbi:MAG: hypothetical protein BA871_06645 [Desulfuromonadales bacterium C00003096]|jgi:hypothetical protein|nr:MAG: hypothetical protein BA871_06645 [Desulfuromonadales bacterium C00003096]